MLIEILNLELSG